MALTPTRRGTLTQVGCLTFIVWVANGSAGAVAADYAIYAVFEGNVGRNVESYPSPQSVWVVGHVYPSVVFVDACQTQLLRVSHVTPPRAPSLFLSCSLGPTRYLVGLERARSLLACPPSDPTLDLPLCYLPSSPLH